MWIPSTYLEKLYLLGVLCGQLLLAAGLRDPVQIDGVLFTYEYGDAAPCSRTHPLASQLGA